MPIIPKAQLPNVDINLVQQPYAPNVDVSSGTQQLAKGVGQVADVFDAKFKKDDENAANDALLSFDDAKNKILFDPDKGYYNTQGRNAVDGAEPTGQSLDKLLQQHLDSIKSGRAKDMFQKAVNERVVRDKAAIMQHASKGQKVWEVSTAEAQVQNAKDNAVNYYNNDDELNTYYATGLAAIHDKNRALDSSTGVTMQEINEYTSSFGASAIQGAISRGDLEAAKALRDRYGNKIKGADALKVDEDLDTLEDKQYVAQKVNEIYSPDKSQTDMNKEILTEPDQDRQKAIRKAVYDMVIMREHAEEEWIRDTINELDTGLKAGAISLSDIDRDVWKKIGVTGRNTLENGQNEYVTGVNVKSDPVLVSQLNTMYSEDKEAFKKLKLTVYYDKLNSDDRKYFDKLQKDAKEGKNDPSLTRINTNSNIMDSKFLTMFPARKTTSELNINERKYYDVYKDMIITKVAIAEEIKGGKLTEEEFNKLNNEMIRSVATGRGFFGGETLSITDVPLEYYNIITNGLYKNGHPITDQNIVKAYLRILNKDESKLTTRGR